MLFKGLFYKLFCLFHQPLTVFLAGQPLVVIFSTLCFYEFDFHIYMMLCTICLPLPGLFHYHNALKAHHVVADDRVRPEREIAGSQGTGVLTLCLIIPVCVSK